MRTSDPVRIPIDDVLDLHAFSRKDVKNPAPEYIEAGRESSIRGILWKMPSSPAPPAVTKKCRCG